MNADRAPATCTVSAHRVGTLPHSLVRRARQATLALWGTSLTLFLVLSMLYPAASAAPGWANLLAGLGLLGGLGTAAVALVAQVLCWIGPLARGTLHAGPDGIAVQAWRHRWIARDAIDAAWILPGAQHAWLEFRLHNGDVVSAKTSPAEATAVLDAAGVDASRRVLRMPLGGAATDILLATLLAVPAVCPASLVASGLSAVLHLPSPALGFVVIVLWVVFVLGAVRLMAPPAVAVGQDGVAVGEGSRAWFVPFSTVSEARYHRGAIELWLRDGRLRRISTLGTREDRRRALYDRIVAGLDASRAPRDLSTRLTALDRNGRSVEDWHAALRALAGARDNYRQWALTPDEIVEALNDAGSSPERRIGAALVLAALDATQGGARVRMVADTVAQAPVRIALERAAEGNVDEALLEAVRAAERQG